MNTNIEYDAVNHPHHYVKNAVHVEPKELTGRINSALGQALQYIIRREDKENEVQDLQKACFWLREFISYYTDKVAFSDPIPFTDENLMRDADAYWRIWMEHTNDGLTMDVLKAMRTSEGYVTINGVESAIKMIEETLNL